MTLAPPTAATTSDAATIDALVARAGALYSLPAVAVEVLRLTEGEKVDVPALKQCIERDPALTAKILRVVNSSIFGLSREVSDLNQALALLGTKPLKLLALGFSLPETLFARAAREQLDWYWRSALVRAVAAREISEQLFRRPGDDAFLAGLLQDLGVLLLLSELGRPYATLLGEAIRARADLRQLERESLGFDHLQLTAGLLRRWNLPKTLVAAIVEERDPARWARSKAEHAPLVRVLHLAELFTQLVGQRRLNVLPDLLEVGGAYCNLDKPRLHALVESLEPKVRQLASVLSLDVNDPGEYAAVLAEAHRQLSAVAESAAGDLSRSLALQPLRSEEDAPGELHALALARQLRASFDEFFTHAPAARGDRPAPPQDDELAADSAEPAAATPDVARHRRPAAPLAGDELAAALTLAVGRCRAARQSVAAVLLAVDSPRELTPAQAQRLERLLHAACRAGDFDADAVERLAENRRLLILAGRDRQEAVAAARAAVEHVRRLLQQMHQAGFLPACVAAAGVAWAATPAKNFRPWCLVETADRCLAAALAAGGVKSLEVS